MEQNQDVALTTKELSERWRVTEGTLKRWRSENVGPPYMMIGERILYRISSVIEYEEKSEVQTKDFKKT